MDFKGSVGYLIHELSQKLTAESDQVLLERYGIGFSQYKVLLSLEVAQGRPQKEIAHYLSQTEASVSRQIGLLIDKNLVIIGPSKDNRQHLIYLTPRGEEMVQKATNALNTYHAPFFQNLSEKQLGQLTNLLYLVKQKSL